MERPARRRSCLALAGVALLLTGCSESPSVLDTRGPAAERIAGLWWLMLVISTVVFVFVCSMLVGALIRGRRRTEDDARRPVRWGEPFIVGVGIVLSSIVLVAVFVISLRDLRAITNTSARPRLTVHVIGHDWWWEARYPNGAVTANEIHIPSGEPVRVVLTTDDVIHSFWVPQLAPKADMIPGKRNVLLFEASSPGTYRGQCAEYCGLQHANMAFHVVAEPRRGFDRWVRAEALPARGEASRGQRVFERSTCAGCHAIRGTDAVGNAGPDLTHVASRRWIAAGTLRNNATNMARWLVDPQGVKPGTAMPPTELSKSDLRALLSYLGRLR